jgi:uncharacterized membrane protein YraQ (UPF0718 family)
LKEQKKRVLRDVAFLGGVLVFAALLVHLFPQREKAVVIASWSFFLEMMAILPAVMVMMGLFMVFVPKDMVVRHLGKSSGIKGLFLAILLGALPTGPLYVSFPIAAALLKKGTRVSNIVVFLSAWACIKLPQEMVEFQFLGPRFMVTRLLLTTVSVIFMGLLIEWIVELGHRKPSDSTE